MPRAGTPKRMRREDRISAILLAARGVFEEFGYEGAKVAEIAQRLGITESNVYAFFDSKRDLMMRVVADWYRTTVTPLQEGVHGIVGTRNKLRYVIWLHLKTMTENVPLCAVVLKESRSLKEEPVSTMLHDLRRQYTEPLMQVLAEGISSGELDPALDRPLVRNMVYGTLEYVVWDAVASRKSVDVERTADALTSAMYAGMTSRSSAPDRDPVHRRMSALLDRMESALTGREP